MQPETLTIHEVPALTPQTIEPTDVLAPDEIVKMRGTIRELAALKPQALILRLQRAVQAATVYHGHTYTYDTFIPANDQSARQYLNEARLLVELLVLAL